MIYFRFSKVKPEGDTRTGSLDVRSGDCSNEYRNPLAKTFNEVPGEYLFREMSIYCPSLPKELKVEKIEVSEMKELTVTVELKAIGNDLTVKAVCRNDEVEFSGKHIIEEILLKEYRSDAEGLVGFISTQVGFEAMKEMMEKSESWKKFVSNFIRKNL